MAVLLILAKASVNKASFFYGPGKFMIWSISVIFIGAIILFISAKSFGYPQKLSAFLNKKSTAKRNYNNKNHTDYSSKYPKGEVAGLQSNKPVNSIQDLSNVCNEFITPLRKLLDSNKVNYENYKANHRLGGAQQVYNFDKKIRTLISTHADIIPESLNGDVNILVEHLNIWINTFEQQTANLKLSPNSTFKVQYDGPDFPVASVQKITKFQSCN
jgi:hypothetical protein